MHVLYERLFLSEEREQREGERERNQERGGGERQALMTCHDMEFSFIRMHRFFVYSILHKYVSNGKLHTYVNTYVCM